MSEALAGSEIVGLNSTKSLSSREPAHCVVRTSAAAQNVATKLKLINFASNYRAQELTMLDIHKSIAIADNTPAAITKTWTSAGLKRLMRIVRWKVAVGKRFTK